MSSKTQKKLVSKLMKAATSIAAPSIAGAGNIIISSTPNGKNLWFDMFVEFEKLQKIERRKRIISEILDKKTDVPK
jgi:hypothetical protein